MIYLQKVNRRRIGVAATVIALVCLIQVAGPGFQLPEWKTYDWRLRLASTIAPPVATNLGAVFIDAETYKLVREGGQGLESQRLPRSYFGCLVNVLKRHGAKTIGLDVLFESPENPEAQTWKPPRIMREIVDELVARWRAETNSPAHWIITPDDRGGGETIISGDALFAHEMRAAGNVVLAAEASPLRSQDFEGVRTSFPLPLFEHSAAALGNATANLAYDGVCREVTAYQDYGNGRIWDMGIVLAAHALKLDLSNAVVEPNRIILRGEEGVERIIPTQGNSFYINWTLAWDDARITKGAFEEVIGLKETAANPEIWRDKIVLVQWRGSEKDQWRNVAATALSKSTPLGSKHLNVANSIITGQFIQKMGTTGTLLLIVLMGICGVLLAARFRGIRGVLALLALGTIYVSLMVILFVKFLYWAPIVYPMVCTVITAQLCSLGQRVAPMDSAKEFFGKAGFRKVEELLPGLLVLHPADGQTVCLATLWRGETNELPPGLVEARNSLRSSESARLNLYLIYDGKAPSSDAIRPWRDRLDCEVVPVHSGIIEKALSRQDLRGPLRELEEPYLTRADPYADFKPIADPTWFYGRADLISRLPAALAQGQHIAIFGLRKVGKTSLTHQLRQRFQSTPSVFLDCQAISAKAESYFDAIYRELHCALRTLGMKGLPKLRRITDEEEFTRGILELFERWEASGRREPFVLVMDEIDKLCPNPEIHGREEVLVEYVRVFQALRGLAQSRQCVVICAISYRPTVNRQNLLSPGVGENPMFKSFLEVFLGFLNASESAAMVREIGLWKNIVWDPKAAERVFEFCGGHPLITRYFASHACREGTLKRVDESRVLETVSELLNTLRKNEIGNYYKEAIADLLSPEEKLILNVVFESGENGYAEADVAPTLEEALTNVENFGLVQNTNKRLCLAGKLFRSWLDRRRTGVA